MSVDHIESFSTLVFVFVRSTKKANSDLLLFYLHDNAIYVNLFSTT